ncbi:hypothetical protein Trydic_g3899 [Trypoxylus dichotomus]
MGERTTTVTIKSKASGLLFRRSHQNRLEHFQTKWITWTKSLKGRRCGTGTLMAIGTNEVMIDRRRTGTLPWRRRRTTRMTHQGHLETFRMEGITVWRN